MNSILKKSGYTINKADQNLTIINRRANLIVFDIILMIVGIFVLYFAASSLSWKLSLFGIILIGVPFTSNRWRLPRKLIFHNDSGDLEIHYLSKRKIINSISRPELAVDYYAKSAFVSPFQEGNQEHFYTFQAILSEQRINLFRIKSRTRIDDRIQKMTNDFAGLAIFR